MANYTSVIASNICDAAGNKLASGTVSFQATDAANQPLNFQVGGGGQVVTTPATAAIVAGAIAGGFQVADSANTSPAGILYRITITDTTLNRVVIAYSLVAVTGTTFSLDSYSQVGVSVLPPTGGSVNGPLTVTGNLSVTGALSLGSLSVGAATVADLITSSTPVMDVRAFGAKCDGATNDATAVQAAFTAAAAVSGIALIPAGLTCVHTTALTLGAANLALEGTLKAGAAMTYQITVGTPTSDVIRHAVYGHGTFDGNTVAAAALWLQWVTDYDVGFIHTKNHTTNAIVFGNNALDSNHLSSGTIHDTVMVGIQSAPGTIGLWNQWASDSAFINNEAVDFVVGMQNDKSQNKWFLNHAWGHSSPSVMTTCFYDTAGKGTIWVGNEIDTPATYGIRVGSTAASTVIIGNKFYNNDFLTIDNTAFAIHFDNSFPSGTISGNHFFGEDSSHRWAKDIDASNLTNLQIWGNLESNVVLQTQSRQTGAGLLQTSDLTTAAIKTSQTTFDGGSGVNVTQVDPFDSSGTQGSLYRIFRGINTTGNSAFVIYKANNSTSINHFFAANNAQGSYVNADNGTFQVGSSGACSGSAKFCVTGSMYATGGFNNQSSTLMISPTAPSISSGFGASPSVASNNGTVAFVINVGTGGAATNGVIGMPTATTGWNCSVNNITAAAGHRADSTVQTASTTGTVTIENQTKSTGAAIAWTASDLIRLSCFAY